MEKLPIIKDFLFPKICVDCGTEGQWWCKEHRHFLDQSGIWRCPICKVENKTGSVCICCQKESHLDGIVSFFPFFEPSPLSELLHDYKYGFIKDLEGLWQEMIVGNKVFRREDFWTNQDTTFSFIPLFPVRERWRGFNQAEKLAKIFLFQAREYFPEKDFVLTDLLERVKKTRQQAKLKREERMENIKDAFKIKNRPQKRVVLIDDVFTTGATLQEAARICKEAGAQEVWALTLFRAE